MASEKVSVEEAVKRLMEVDAANASKINKLEGQIDEMLKVFNEYREQNANSTRAEFQTMSERIESVQSLTASYFDEAASKYEESKRMYADMNTNMNCILNKLDHITGSGITSSIDMQNNAAKREEYENGRPSTSTINTNLGYPLPTTTYPTTSTSGHISQTIPYFMEPEVKQEAAIQSTFPLKNIKHSIIVPPSSAAPAFHGQHSQSPTQFLIRVSGICRISTRMGSSNIN